MNNKSINVIARLEGEILMTDKAEDVKALRRWPGSVEILLEDFEWMEATIASQAAEIERLTACVAEYIVQIDEIASQAAEIERLHEQGIHLAKTLIKYLPSNVRQSCDSAELWADIDGILYHD